MNALQGYVDLGFERHGAVATLRGPLVVDRALALVRRLDQAVGYYQYRNLEIAIDSPGGEGDALKHVLDALGRLRRRGVRVATRGLTEACSAAALLLSSGAPGHRRVASHTRLLYHHGRLPGDILSQQLIGAELTASRTDRLLQALTQMRDGLARIDDHFRRHLQQATLGGAERRDAWIGRLEAQIDPWRTGTLDAERAGWMDRLLDGVRVSEGRIARHEASCERLARNLADGLEAMQHQDRPISPHLARLLMLVDRVDDEGGPCDD
jgi:hypothetical protein